MIASNVPQQEVGLEYIVTEIDHAEFDGLKLTRRTDGKHLRITDGGANRAVGRFFSVKCGTTFPWESAVERDDMRNSEVDTRVVSFSVQSEKLNWVQGGRAFQYTPDLVDIMDDGKRRVVEVKHQYRADRDPNYDAKLKMVVSIYATRGVDFVIRDEMTIRSQPAFSVVDEIDSYKRTAILPDKLSIVLNQLRTNDSSIGALCGLMSVPHARAMLCAMHVQRFISIDVTSALSPKSHVTAVR